AVMARALAKATGVPVLHALRRTRDTLRQSDLPLAERAANVSGAFTARPAQGRVVLVDDVVTSAETVRQASAALLTAGATEVDVVAFARATHDEVVSK
ncbi:MAG: ComF family protein, partial [Deltaproteobacteria bacterium]|nr:ComF family protein [Deltaproteobacteria bacterium]